MATTQRNSLFSALHALTEEIATEKTAAVRTKKADNPVPSDPGGYAGASTHPTAHVDNRGQTASEGSRSSENESDVNEDQGATGVNKAPDARPGQQDDVQLNIGTQQSATGEDASVEDDYKAGKDDPGSSHPARTDNNALDGHKYAHATLSQCVDLSTTLANDILAGLAMGHGSKLTKQALAEAGGLQAAPAGVNPPAKPKTQMAGQPPQGQPTMGQQKVASSPLSEMIEKAANAVRTGNTPANSPAAMNPDLAAGYELATYLGIEKKAAQEVVAELIESAINDANHDADLFGAFYSTYMQKRASEGASPTDGEEHSSKGDDSSGANGAEGAGGETSGEVGGSHSGGGGGGESLGDKLGGGSDPGGILGAAPGGGAPGGGAPGGDPMGGASEQDALMQLAAALDELGIPIEALAQAGGGAPGGAGGGMGGGMGDGMPPADPLGGMGGGMPPAGGPPGAGGPPAPGGAPPMPPGGGMTEGMKLASAILSFKRSGQYRFKQAADGSRDRVLREQMKSHVRELLNLS